MPLVGKKFRARKKTRIRQEPDLLYLYLAITEIAMSPPFTTFGNARISVETSGSRATHSTTPFFS